MRETGAPCRPPRPAPRTHMARARHARRGQVQVSSPCTGRVFSRRFPQGDGLVEAWNGVSSPWSLGCGCHPGELLVRLGLPSCQGHRTLTCSQAVAAQATCGGCQKSLPACSSAPECLEFKSRLPRSPGSSPAGRPLAQSPPLSQACSGPTVTHSQGSARQRRCGVYLLLVSHFPQLPGKLLEGR